MSEDRKDVYLVVYDPNYNEIARGTKGSNSVSLKGLKPNTTYLEGNFTVVYSSDNGISGRKYLPTFKTQPRLVSDFTVDSEVHVMLGENKVVFVNSTEPADATNNLIVASVADEGIATISGGGNSFNIKPLKAGKTTITYKTQDGSNIVKEQTLVVEEAPKLPNDPLDVHVDAGTNSIKVSAM